MKFSSNRATREIVHQTRNKTKVYEIIRNHGLAGHKIETAQSGEGWILTLNEQREDSSTQLRERLRSNRLTGKGGIYAVCSAHPAVIDAAFQQSLDDAVYRVAATIPMNGVHFDPETFVRRLRHGPAA